MARMSPLFSLQTLSPQVPIQSSRGFVRQYLATGGRFPREEKPRSGIGWQIKSLSTPRGKQSPSFLHLGVVWMKIPFEQKKNRKLIEKKLKSTSQLI